MGSEGLVMEQRQSDTMGPHGINGSLLNRGALYNQGSFVTLQNQGILSYPLEHMELMPREATYTRRQA